MVAILALLLGILFPSLMAAREAARRSVCSNNCNELLKGCSAYAQRTSLHMGRNTVNNRPNTPGMLPCVDPETDSWSDPRTGNAAALWLLVKHDFVEPESLVCPTASQVLGHEPGADDADGIVATATETTCSYGYISMVREEGGTEGLDVREQTTLERLPGRTAVVGDGNPRASFNDNGLQAVYAGSDLSQGNSDNHRKAGQNIGILDGAVLWREVATLDEVDGSDDDLGDVDYIYSSGDGASKVIRKNIEDNLLIP